MKKLTLLVVYFAFISFTAISFASERCTMGVIGKNGTSDGSILIFHNEEIAPGTAAERLVIRPRETHQPGEMKKVGWEMIPQVPITYRRIGNLYWPGGSPPGDWVTGLNEFGVTLVSNAEKSKETDLPPNTGLSFCDITEVVTERARTAREAVESMGRLIDTFGMGGPWANSCWVMADQKEVWFMEASLRHWVARKVGDDEILPISNRYNIGTKYDLSSADVIKYAVEQKWYDPGSGVPFSWKDVYGVPANQDSPRNINREDRIRKLLTAKWGSISIKDCFDLARDHYEGTELYSYPSHNAPAEIRPICSGNNLFGAVYQMRSWLPTKIGALMWYRMAAACSGVYVPIYEATTRLPETYTMDLSDKSDPVSAWWRFRNLMNNVDKNYNTLNPNVRKSWSQFEEIELREIPKLEENALKAYQSGDINLMEKLLTDYTYTHLNDAYNTAAALNDEVQKVK
jgi:dipeptidase